MVLWALDLGEIEKRIPQVYWEQGFLHILAHLHVTGAGGKAVVKVTGVDARTAHPQNQHGSAQ